MFTITPSTGLSFVTNPNMPTPNQFTGTWIGFAELNPSNLPCPGYCDTIYHFDFSGDQIRLFNGYISGIPNGNSYFNGTFTFTGTTSGTIDIMVPFYENIPILGIYQFTRNGEHLNLAISGPNQIRPSNYSVNQQASIFYLDFPTSSSNNAALNGVFSGTTLGGNCNISNCPNSQVVLTFNGINQGSFANTDIYGNVINGGTNSFTYQVLSTAFIYSTNNNGGGMYVQYEITAYGDHLDLLATTYLDRTYSLTSYQNNNNNNNNNNNTDNQNNQNNLISVDKRAFQNLLAPKFTGTIVGTWTGNPVNSTNGCSCPGTNYYAAFIDDGGFALSQRYSNNLTNVGPDGTYTGNYTTDTSSTPNRIQLYVDIFDEIAYAIFRVNNTANATLELVITQPGNTTYPTKFAYAQNQQYFIFYSSPVIGSSIHSSASTLFISTILILVIVIINIFTINH